MTVAQDAGCALGRHRVLPRSVMCLFVGLFLAAVPAAAQMPSDREAVEFQEGLAAYEAGDAERAFEVWSDAAAQGDGLAQYGLGKLYETGLSGFPADLALAVEWYQKSADQGVPAALNNLARLFADGRGVARDTERAVLLWAQAAQLGHPHAQYNLGVALFRGEWIARDQAAAVDWFLQSAAGGLPEAQFAAGQVYERGIHRDADRQRALQWYRQAAEQGHLAAAESVQRLEDAGAPPPASEGLAASPQPAARPVPTPPEAALPPLPPRRPEFAARGPVDARGATAPLPASPPQALEEAEPEAAPAMPQVAGPADVPSVGPTGGWRVWLGSASSPAEAQDLARALAAGSPVLSEDEIERVPSDGGLRLLAGRFDARAQAVALCSRLRSTAPAAFCIPVEQ